MKLIRTKQILIIILIISAFLRFFRLDYPKAYVFDEVYHGFTAKEYALGHKAAWEWWTTPPAGVAYEWTHPPLAKEIMALSIKLLSNTDPIAWRIPGAILGVISIYLVFLLGRIIFKKDSIALLSAFIFSLDGLNFVQSRTGMNDIYVITFILTCLLFALKRQFFISSLFFGLAISSKWSGIYLLPLILLLIIKSKDYKNLIYYLIIPPIIYMMSYLPFFLLGHSFDQFKELQRQMFYYHSHLKAHHDYSSPWWSWPLNLYPVWYFVEYQKNTISNIFAGGNPAVFLPGVAAVIATLVTIKNKSKQMLIPILGYFLFLLPWAFSPRIMFIYHYSPSVPFLSLILGYQIDLFAKGKKEIILLSILLISLGFLAVYPYLTGVPLPRDLVSVFFRTNLTKNPFR